MVVIQDVVKATDDAQKMYGSPDEAMMNSTTATVIHVITNYLNIKLIYIFVVLYEIIHCHT